MKLITEEWLDKAREDLDVALEIISKEHLTNMVAFHSQQAVEKTLKGIIEEFEIGFVKIHNLERLLGMVKKKMSLDVDLNIIKRLDEVYISTRYPSDLGLLPSGKPTIQDAKELYDFADALYRNVKKLLEQSAEEDHENNKRNEGKD
jgi:HEPN domain-containing protein